MFDKSDEEHWYALKVFYNRVFDVERLLAQDGVKTYIPLRSTETTVGGRTRGSVSMTSSAPFRSRGSFAT